jgi:hypothetical protein
LIPDRLSFVFPLATEIGFVNFNSTGEDPGNTLCQSSSNDGERSEHPQTFYGCAKSDILTTLFKKEPFDDLFPLILSQFLWKSMRKEIISALATTSLSIG